MSLNAKQAYLAVIAAGWEQNQVIAFAKRAVGSNGGKLLDIGCGYGRNLKGLREHGIDAVGIDVNPEIVRIAVASGLPCKTVEDFERETTTFDALLMSHIIEHFVPRASSSISWMAISTG